MLIYPSTNVCKHGENRKQTSRTEVMQMSGCLYSLKSVVLISIRKGFFLCQETIVVHTPTYVSIQHAKIL